MEDLQQKIIELMDLFDEGEVTTADKIDRPQRALDREAYDDFMKRNPMAGGGRIGLYKGMSAKKAPQKLKLETPKVLEGSERPTKKGTKKYKDIKSIRALDPDYLGKINIEKVDKKVDNKFVKVYKSGATKYGSVLDDAIEIRNIIVNNKGNIFGFEELGEKAGIYTSGTGSRKSGKGNRPDIRRIRAALILAKDNFPEIANFKFVPERYPGIDGKERQLLNMMVDTIKAYQNSTGDEKLAQFLPDNMGQFYTRVIEKGSKKLPANPKKGIYMKMYNFKPNQIKYISDRITDETGQKFTSKDYNNLVNDVRKFRSQVSTNKRLETRLANMNKVIVDLANDNQIQNLLKGTLDRKTQEALLARATQIVGGDASIASRRLFQMAEAMSDTTNAYKNLGIELNNEKANKIIATGKEIGGRNNRYGMSSVLYDYYGNVVDKAIGSGEGQTFIGKYQQAIRNALDKGQSPDEIFSLTASARTRVPGQGNLAPYALFTQQLRTDVNSAIKGAYIDSALSRTHGKLQEIFKGRKYSQLNAAEKKEANLLVEAFEKEKTRALKQPINPGEVKKGAKPIYLTATEKKNMQLPSFDLKNPPSKSIEGFATRFVKYPKIKEAFEKSYKDVGYSMKVTKDMKTQKEFLDNLVANSKLDKCVINRKADGGRIGFALSDECIRDGLNETKKKAAAGDKKAARQLVETAEAATKGRLLKNILGPGAILGEALFEGALIGNKILGGKPADISYAESYLSYLDPRKYSGELDPLKMQREDMLESTADKDILRSGFAAQDQLSAFNKAIRDREIAKARGRTDQYNVAAADAREQGRFADQSADIISSEAFKDASNIAQEYLQGKAGEQMSKFGVLSVPQGDDADNLRRLKANKAMQNLYTQYSDDEVRSFLKQSLGTDDDELIDKYLDLTGVTERITPAVTRTLSGLDVLRTGDQIQQSLQRIADAGGVANLARGGRAGFKVGKLAKLRKSKVREDVKNIIDDSIKKQEEREFSPNLDLDALIKKTLDEDFLDKKDTIIDTLNAKIARERKNFPYNQQVFEEPSQLDFYDAITKSNFRTKTGPFFDYQKRKNKAGGGLLKQAGDRSGPPPESGPNSQGLQGLLNRGKNI